jgi:hypothetical protein
VKNKAEKGCIKYENKAFAKKEKTVLIDINKQHKKILLKYME